jgi:hypothetical protein
MKKTKKYHNSRCYHFVTDLLQAKELNISKLTASNNSNKIFYYTQNTTAKNRN